MGFHLNHILLKLKINQMKNSNIREFEMGEMFGGYTKGMIDILKKNV